MLDIKITDDLKITSDEHNFIVERKQTSKKNKNNWKSIGFYPTFEMAACNLIEGHISALDARKLKEVITAIDDLKRTVIAIQASK